MTQAILAKAFRGELVATKERQVFVLLVLACGGDRNGSVDPKNFEYAIQKVEDGFLFGRLCGQLLKSVAWGCLHACWRRQRQRNWTGCGTVFVSKRFLKGKFIKLYRKKGLKQGSFHSRELPERNKIDFDRLVFVSNQVVKNQEADDRCLVR